MFGSTTAEDRIGMAGAERWNGEFSNDGRKQRTRTTGRGTSISKRLNVALWTLQVLLAALFLVAGATKLLIPVEVLMSMGSPNQIVLPGWFVKFIGLAEVLGAIGLILPRFLRIRPGLTPLASAGLLTIMIGAISLTAAADGFAAALFPLIIGFIAGVVAYHRSSERLSRR